MKKRLEEIRIKGLEKIESVKNIIELEEVKKELTGKKSGLSEVLKSMRSLSVEEKKTIGMLTTEIKSAFADKLKHKEEQLIEAMSVLDGPIDLTLPCLLYTSFSQNPLWSLY